MCVYLPVNLAIILANFIEITSKGGRSGGEGLQHSLINCLSSGSVPWRGKKKKKKKKKIEK